MNCQNIRKQIHEYFDGDAELSSFAMHLETCPQCKAFYEAMLRQKALLSELSAENAPKFDLSAAKKQKKQQTSRMIRWASAAAAVLVAVIITGSLGLFSGADFSALSADRPEGESGAIMEESAADAPAADAPAADAPAADEPAAAPPEPQEEFFEDGTCGAPLAPEEDAPAADAEDFSFFLTLPEDEYQEIHHILEEHGFLLEPDEEGFYVHYTSETSHELLSELLAPYSNQTLSPHAEMILIEKN